MPRAMATPKRIGILTGGGDVPGLNGVIKSVVYRATELGYEVLGIRRGWEGLTHVQPELPDGGGTGYLLPARPDQHPHHRPDRRHDAAHLAHEPAQDAGRPACRPGWPRPTAARYEVADGVYDLTPLVLEHLDGPRGRLPRHHRRRRHAVASRRSWPTPACPSSPSPRRWTTTSRAPSTASASRPPSPAPRRPSTGSARRSAPTSASASSASSAATPGSPRCTRRT